MHCTTLYIHIVALKYSTLYTVDDALYAIQYSSLENQLQKQSVILFLQLLCQAQVYISWI